jgi:hypothetical protein
MVVNAYLHVKRIFARKEYVLFRGMTSMQRGFLMHSWEWERQRTLQVKNVAEGETGRGF